MRHHICGSCGSGAQAVAQAVLSHDAAAAEEGAVRAQNLAANTLIVCPGGILQQWQTEVQTLPKLPHSRLFIAACVRASIHQKFPRCRLHGMSHLASACDRSSL